MQMYFQPESAASLTRDIVIAREPQLRSLESGGSLQHEGRGTFYLYSKVSVCLQCKNYFLVLLNCDRNVTGSLCH